MNRHEIMRRKTFRSSVNGVPHKTVVRTILATLSAGRDTFANAGIESLQTSSVVTGGARSPSHRARQSDTPPRRRFNSSSGRCAIKWRRQAEYRWKSVEGGSDPDVGMKPLQSNSLRWAFPESVDMRRLGIGQTIEFTNGLIGL